MNIFSGYILISLIPIFIYSIITTEKLIFFLGISFALLPFFSREYNFLFKNKFKFFLVLISLIVFFIGIEFVRHGATSINYNKDRIGLYLLAQYSSFGWWVLEHYSYDCCKLGAMTFIGPLDFFGFIDRKNGIYESFYFINQDLKTNIYTGWRFLVEDFSIIGPLVFNTLTAILFSFSIKNKMFKLSFLIRNFIIFSALLSLILTPFTHNSTLLAFVLVLFFLAMLPNKNKLYAN
jgi:oligosaccharide repeat unit polymerase